MSIYTPTIGLEIHAELKTKTKMFCNSKNDPDEKSPNVNICPVCMGHPGTLPTINKEAVRHVLKVGTALGGELATNTYFDRKNYFYPDLPKGYQVSQYKNPLVSGGTLKDVLVTRIHLEEDTARSSHETGNTSLVDFNRAGIPLMELVTEPVIKSGKQASDFARELRLLLRSLEAGEANMEKGEMRVEANVSISDSDSLGTKVEIKNLNSLKAVEQAVAFEIGRQEDVLKRGEQVLQETRGWDENKQITFPQRIKEESQDYRYFPEPDLPRLDISDIPEFSLERLKSEISELPWEKRSRYADVYGIKDEDIEALVQDKKLGTLFEEATEKFADDKNMIQTAANYITSDLVGILKRGKKASQEISMTSESFCELMLMIKEGTVSSRGAKDVLSVLAIEGGDAKSVGEGLGLIQKSNEDELKLVVSNIISSHKDVVEDYKAGKESALQYLVGQAMKETKGSANPQILQKLFKELL